jgi:DNA repair protein RecN (Recombination protein N)
VLVEIVIEQFALIEHLRLQFPGGLNVLTGETGAGKSIILDAVGVVLGGRGSADVVRAGEEKATVEALFDLSGLVPKQKALAAMGITIDDDQLLIVRREVSRSGRGVIRINGRTVTAGMCKEVTDGLVDLHGQHEHQSLLNADRHMDLLDQYGGSLLREEGKSLDLLDQYAGGPILKLRAEVASLAQALHAVSSERRQLVGNDRDRTRREDLLRFQLEELSTAALREGEEETLEAELQVLSHAGKLKLTTASAYGLLYEGSTRQVSVIDTLGRVKGELQEVVRYDPSLAEALEMVESALVQVQEASHTLAAYRDRVEDDPARLGRLEARRDQLHSLKRKYGDSVSEMVAYLAQVSAELDRSAHSEELLAQLTAKEAELGQEAERAAHRLTESRRIAALQLGARVAAELIALGMGSARFEVVVHPPEQPSYHAVGNRGWDRVEFLFSPNPGEPLKPLAKIVSGGEMSRIMLALKVILARVDGVPTLVFDEVDTGISGRAAQAVAEKLARIGGDRQVLCVTHLPQVAAMADAHFLIAKQTEGGRTRTHLSELDLSGRAEELARMIGGAEVSAVTLEAARDMLQRADHLKQDLRSA